MRPPYNLQAKVPVAFRVTAVGCNLTSCREPVKAGLGARCDVVLHHGYLSSSDDQSVAPNVTRTLRLFAETRRSHGMIL